MDLPVITITKRSDDSFVVSIKRGPSKHATSLPDALKVVDDFLSKAVVQAPPSNAGPVGYAVKRKKVDVTVDDPASSVTVTASSKKKSKFSASSD